MGKEIQEQAARGATIGERLAVPLDAEEDEVRHDAGRVQGSLFGLGDVAGRADARQARHRGGEAPGVGVVLGKALDHARGAIPEGDHPGRGQDAGLAHTATEQLPRATGPPDEVARADDHAADRAGEAFREAERDGVGGAGQLRARDPEGDGRVPEAGPIDMEPDSVLVGDGRDLGRIGNAERPSHRMSVGVLDDDEPRDRLVRVARVAERLFDLDGIEGAVGSLAERPDGRPRDHGVTGRLVQDDVALVPGDRLLAAREVGHLGHEVAHRARGHEQPSFLAQELGRALLEGMNGGIVAEDVVADLGLGHRPPHLGRGPGDGVGTKVDQVHALGEDTARSVRGPGGGFPGPRARCTVRPVEPREPTPREPKPPERTPRDHGYRADARLRQASSNRTRGTILGLVAIIASGFAFSILKPEGLDPAPSRTGLAGGPVATSLGHAPTPVAALAVLGQPAPRRPVPMMAGWLQWLDPLTGALMGDAAPPEAGATSLTFVDAAGEAVQVCVAPAQNGPDLTVEVHLCSFLASGHERDEIPIATFHTPLFFPAFDRSVGIVPLQLDATVSRDGRWLWLASAALVNDHTWAVEVRRVDLASDAVIATRTIREIPVREFGLQPPSAEGWLLESGWLLRPVIRASPDGAELSLTLTASDPTAVETGLLRQERVVIPSSLDPNTAISVAFPSGGPSDLACDPTRASWATERHYLTLCSHQESDRSLQPFVRIESPDDMTRDVAVGTTIPESVAAFDDSSWLLNARTGRLYRWAPEALQLSSLDVATRAGTTVILAPAGLPPAGGIETPAGGVAADGQLDWTQLTPAGASAAGLQLAGSGDGRYLYATARPPRAGFGGRLVVPPRSVVWVIEAATNRLLGRGDAPAEIDQIALAPGGGPLLEMLTPTLQEGPGLVTDWVEPVWFVDQATGQTLEVAGQVRGPGTLPGTLLPPLVGRLAGF